MKIKKILRDHIDDRFSFQRGKALKPNPVFNNYKSCMEDVLKRKSILTDDAITFCDISYDSTKVILVTKNGECASNVIMFDIKTFTQDFHETIGGQPEQYIKINKVVQNHYGTQFAITYIDDGKFRIRTFGKEQRSPEEIEKNEFKINE